MADKKTELTPLQIKVLRAVEHGDVSQQNFGHGSWRILGANPSSVGRLTSLGFIRWTKVIGGDAELTQSGRDAIAKAEGRS